MLQFVCAPFYNGLFPQSKFVLDIIHIYIIYVLFLHKYLCLTSVTCAKPKEKMAFPAKLSECYSGIFQNY